MKAVAALIGHFLLSHEQGTFIKDTFYYNEGAASPCVNFYLFELVILFFLLQFYNNAKPKSK